MQNCGLWSSGLYRSVVLYVLSNVSEERIASIFRLHFYLKVGGDMLLRNAGNHQRYYKTA
jgi:hypothetical protein